MNKLAMYEMLLEDHPLWTKEAFLSKALPTAGGALLGGTGGALSTKDPEKRKERALMGATIGGLGGEVLRRGKAMRGLSENLGSMTEQFRDQESVSRGLQASLNKMTSQRDLAEGKAAVYRDMARGFEDELKTQSKLLRDILSKA